MSVLHAATTAPVTRVQIARYAGAVGDFNPIHLDDAFATQAGLPSVIAHGPLTLALVVDQIVAQVGPGALRSFDARLRAPVFPGDELTLVPAGDGLEVRNANDTVVASVTLDLKSE
ncbi:MaoC family dehydratase N-terminal domain-containing protein [Acidiferrimicrobium sp. IK]|uniref:MaoC/PaaZ C-terminal domain-containing protein n=1 Tax=Acidiferrimicrobium sp. IK TaxID=2871700 RepID=UPI0021CB742B|nr:MaoC/PaaZ C-terminal domain-containing protein [Acidiferrimicrobium sp. IK]MCU4186648.1 MaoC family dehydratase N-terminal domain-containing protein [Acidiferrimicrobium sp. IK]